MRISCCFENKRHLTQIKGRSLDETEAFALKVWMRGYIVESKHFTSKVKLVKKTLSRAVYICFYSNNDKGKQEKQVTHTYPLIEAKIFMETTK